MKRTLFAILILFVASLAAAQEAPKAERAQISTRDYRNRVYEVKHRDPQSLARSLRLLGSGFPGSEMSVNDDLKTITVRDFPENLVAIEDALKRLDQPVSGTPEIEFHVYVLIASNAPGTARTLPDELVPVVKQLEATLRYSSYGLLTTSVHHTRAGNGIESSGVAEAKLLGMSTSDMKPIMYAYTLRRITVPQGATRESADVENFKFSMRIPINTGNAIQYQDVGFETPVTIREGEKVVVGTTTMGEKALVVVVTATVN